MPDRTDLSDRVPHTTPDLDDRPVLVLEVVRGSTRFPRRPVLTDRFLVGGSPACDLHLGGEELPPYHSLIVHQQGTYRWEAVMPEPAVLHNNRLEDWFELHDGDRVAIGEFELAVHLELIEEVAASVGVRAEDLDAADTIAIQDRSAFELAARMSAEDLVDRLEREMSAVESVEQRQRLGAAALLHAARERVASTAPPSRAGASLGERLDAVGERFNRFAAELQRALEAIRNGTSTGSQSIDAVLTAQTRLTGELRSLRTELVAEAGIDDDAQRPAA